MTNILNNKDKRQKKLDKKCQVLLVGQPMEAIIINHTQEAAMVVIKASTTEIINKIKLEDLVMAIVIIQSD